MPTVTLQHVTKTFPGGVTAVDDVSLEVADGELLVLMGPSGCGKTTLLRMIAGVETMTSGTVAMGGRVVNRLPPKQRDVAMIFQGQALYPHMNVYRNMAFGLKLRKTPRAEIERRVREAAEMLGIEDLLDRRPVALSGGQQQRVALGRALVRRPKLFLLDEPLAHLDVRRRDRMRGEIRRLFDRLRTTMIYVTHDPGEAMALAARIAVLRKGRLQQVADPATLYDQPANRFVAERIGTRPMNFFEGRIEVAEGAAVFRHADFSLAVPAEWRPRLEQLIQNRVLLGVRPENLNPAPPGLEGRRAVVSGTIETIESLGSEAYVTLNTGTNQCLWRSTDRPACRAGDRMELAVAVDHLHWFDADSEESIGRPLSVRAETN